jgi:hypothetical protein
VHRLGDEVVHAHREAVVAREHRVDLVPGVAHDEATLVVGQLGAVAAHRKHDRLDVLSLAVDQRPIEVEQERVGAGAAHFSDARSAAARAR